MRRGDPCFVTWGPDSSCGAVTLVGGYALRALIHLGGLFVPRYPDSSYWALVRPSGPWSITWALICSAGSWLVSRGPDSFCGAIYFVLRGPHPSRGTLICFAEPWFVPQPLIRRSGSWSDVEGPDPFHGPWFVPRFPGSFCRALMLPAGLRSVPRGPETW